MLTVKGNSNSQVDLWLPWVTGEVNHVFYVLRMVLEISMFNFNLLEAITVIWPLTHITWPMGHWWGQICFLHIRDGVRNISVQFQPDWSNLKFWPFLTFDPITVGLTTGSPLTVLYLCPCGTLWHCYFCHSKWFLKFDLFWPLTP